MATIQKRKRKNGSYSYRVIIRNSDGYPPVTKTFPYKQEAVDWARDEEARRRQGIYFPDQANQKKTLAELIDSYIETVLPTKPKNAADTKRQLLW